MSVIRAFGFDADAFFTKTFKTILVAFALRGYADATDALPAIALRIFGAIG